MDRETAIAKDKAGIHRMGKGDKYLGVCLTAPFLTWHVIQERLRETDPNLADLIMEKLDNTGW